MQELFEILNLPENSAKEDVKAAFLAWKKEQQKLLSHGKREEQKSVTENITKVTALYKQFMSDAENSATTAESKKTTSDNVKVDSPNTVNRNQEKKTTPPRQRIVNEAIHITTPSAETDAATNPQTKMVVTVLITIVIALSGAVLFLLNDKDKVAMESSTVVPILKKEEKNNKTAVPETLKLNEVKPERKETPELPKVQDKNPGKTVQQRAAVQTLLDFHDNITKKNFGKAYDCLSWDFQSYMSYDGWVPGFSTTVSSEVDDIKIVSESGNKIVLTYILKAVDNINGRQETTYFNGTVSVISENGNWKIDEIKNKVR